ncbi:DUF2490 domain-containing protein [Aquimarina sp. AD10]|nr:DUF2490 domain-containing protein [Aquimarina sp. AD10]RKN01307.1 DUF2490 domain-containing protein [Aquimarina sp. AD10]
MRKTFYLFFCIMIYSFSWSQSTFTSGLLPRIRISSKLTNTIKWVNGIESRQLFTDNTKKNSFDYFLTDISSLASFKIGHNSSLNGGYLLRIEDNQVTHRTIQQYSFVYSYHAIRVGHRFVTDQTFSTTTLPKYRGRYRVTLEKPLNGDKINPNEFYIKLSNEYLFSYQDSKLDIELRVLPFLGYELNLKNKIEAGIDYRLSKFINSDPKNTLWFTINWFYTIQNLKNKK